MPARTPEECDALFAEYVNSGNRDGLLSLYEPNASFVQQDGSPLTGHPAIRESLGALFEMRPRIRMNVAKVVRAGDDLAVVYNDWTMSGTGPEGPLQLSGRATEVVRRQPNGTWLFAVDDPWARG